MTTTAQVYPGLLDNSIELFNTPQGLKVIFSGHVIAFSEIPTPIYLKIKEAMINDTKAYKLLNKWFPNSELSQVEKYASCRFGGLDFSPDFTKNNLQEAEYNECPVRKHCKGNGIICKQLRYNNQILSDLDIKLLKHLSTNLTNEVISDLINTSLGQFHKIKKQLYLKLKIQTKQEATLIALRLNIIKIKANV